MSVALHSGPKLNLGWRKSKYPPNSGRVLKQTPQHEPPAGSSLGNPVSGQIALIKLSSLGNFFQNLTFLLTFLKNTLYYFSGKVNKNNIGLCVLINGGKIMRGRKCYLLHPSGEWGRFLSFPLFFLLLLFYPFSSHSQTQSQTQNQCVTCHTSARKLIQITREIKKTHPKSAKSALTKGEG